MISKNPRPSLTAALLILALVALATVVLIGPARAATPPDLRAKYVGLRAALVKGDIRVGPRLPRSASIPAHIAHIKRLRRLREDARRSAFRYAVASYYGPGLYGNLTACGQTLTPGTIGVAHKSLPCGTRIVVCARRCVTTRVIDRGPYVAGREFDLTAALRSAVGFGSVGTIRVRVG